MNNQQQSDQNRQAGRNGGYVSTSGMSSQDKQRTDIEVNSGRKEAKR